MYEQFLTTFKDQFAPFNTVAEINKKTAEKLIEIQTAYLTEFVNAGFAQFQALTSVKEPKAVIDLQVSFLKDLETKMTSVAEAELATISSAREELTSVIEDNMKTLAETDYLKEISNFDIAKFMPAVDAAKTAKTTARKAPAPKAAAKADA